MTYESNQVIETNRVKSSQSAESGKSSHVKCWPKSLKLTIFKDSSSRVTYDLLTALPFCWFYFYSEYFLLNIALNCVIWFNNCTVCHSEVLIAESPLLFFPCVLLFLSFLL